MSDILHLTALGRPFQLGMLYDCRSDSLIPGITLWDLQTLQSNLNSQDQPSTEMHIIASDSMEEKANALNVSGSLKASLLGGLVEVKGSAKYLNDTKGSMQQARVTLQYKATTRFDQLTMSHLGRQNITYPNVFDEGSATHVVTAVLYGAHAFFVFDRMTSSTENLQDIQGNMEAMVKCLPSIAIQGEASLKMTDEQKSQAEKFSCTFFGDFSLKNNPTTFQEAINIYASLPSLLGSGGEHSVPITVWLYPLNKLDSKAAQLVREISVGLVNRCLGALEQLSEAVVRSNDLMKDKVAIQFPVVRDRILQFREMCLEYKVVFQKTLAIALPSIRGGGQEEGLLADILKNKEQSPFKQQSLTSWLDDKERETKTVGYYLKTLKDIPVMHSTSELDKELMDADIDHVVYFTFTTLQQEDFYLSEADNFLQSHTAQTMQTPNLANGARATRPSEQWFNTPSVTQKMREQSLLFLEFATANREDGKTKFLVASVQDESNVGASIYLWEGSCLTSRNFEPPSQPERPTAAGITHDTVTLQLQPPRYGAGEIVGYKVDYRSREQEEWTTLYTPELSQTITVSGLQPHQKYEFQYRAVTKVGVSKASESKYVVTRPTSPPGKPDFQNCASLILSWGIPSQIGADVKIVQYKIECREETTALSYTESGLCEEVQKTGRQCQYILKGLKPDITYRVRVSAHCGEAGSSEPSEEVMVKIDNAPMRLAVKLLAESQLEIKANPSIFQLSLQKPMMLDQSKELVKCSFGNPSKTRSMKTIMVLGATGSGKTTLINGMINYILGVEWGDNFRYKLIKEVTGKSQAESQTSSITAYELHHQVGFKINYTLTIIDTPGFGDTRGISRDQFITEQIREFFSSPEGVDQIDAVCFVAQASLPRLTPTQKYVFDSILSIFGKDIAENIQILVTFADGQPPPILGALTKAEIPCPKDKNGLPLHFKFNNSAIYAQRPCSGNAAVQGSSDDSGGEEDDENFDAMFWKMGANSMKKFFSALNKMESRSLCLTKEVLRERKQLEVTVEGLQIKIRVGLSKLEELRKTREALKQHQTELDANKDFEYEIEVTVAIKEDISKSGHFITNCQKCCFTCHDVCAIPNDAEKHRCVAMDSQGNCRVCPQKCIWNVHFNQKYKFSYETKKEKRTYDELKKKYEKACGEKMTQQKLLETLQEEFTEVEEAELQLIKQLSQSIRRLEEIALRPNPLSTPAYIDILIQSEKDEAKPGFMERIETLTKVKAQAELIENISNNPKWLPENLNQDHNGEKKGVGKKAKELFSNFMNWFKL